MPSDRPKSRRDHASVPLLGSSDDEPEYLDDDEPFPVPARSTNVSRSFLAGLALAGTVSLLLLLFVPTTRTILHPLALTRPLPPIPLASGDPPPNLRHPKPNATCADAWSWSWRHRDSPKRAKHPPCRCDAACVVYDACCADFEAVTNTTVNHLLDHGVITPPANRDLGSGMSSVWLVDDAARHPLAENDDSFPWPWLVVVRNCIQWSLLDLEPGQSRPAAIPAQVPVVTGPHWALACIDQADVVAVSTNAESVTSFADSFAARGMALPKSVTVAVAAIVPHHNTTSLPTVYYYAQFTDPLSVSAALKALTARLPYCGFACALPYERTGRAATFDSTPGRDWSITRPRFSLQRGAFSRIDHDVSPEQLDKDYEKYVDESRGMVVPWTACFLRQVRLAGEGGGPVWEDVFDVASGALREQVPGSRWMQVWDQVEEEYEEGVL
ncbi:hypothetical protein GGF31_001342 [Allomyces arbusculus]|nr:hypothetical protein GGF31_001342 [Allomyces arbusculus]